MKINNILLTLSIVVGSHVEENPYSFQSVYTESGSYRALAKSYDNQNFYMSFLSAPYSVCKLTREISDE